MAVDAIVCTSNTFPVGGSRFDRRGRGQEPKKRINVYLLWLRSSLYDEPVSLHGCASGQLAKQPLHLGCVDDESLALDTD